MCLLFAMKEREPASWSWCTASCIIGTYLRICHLNLPLEATVQLLKMSADQDSVKDSMPQGSDCDTDRAA